MTCNHNPASESQAASTHIGYQSVISAETVYPLPPSPVHIAVLKIHLTFNFNGLQK